MADWDEEVTVHDQGFDFFLKGMKNYWALLGKEKKNMGLVMFWTFVTQLMALAFPYLLKLVFDEIPAILKTQTISAYLIGLIVSVFILKITQVVVRLFIKETIFLKSTIRLENWWPRMAQEKLLALSTGYHETLNTGKKIAKIEKGCDRLVQITCDLSWSILPQLFYLVANLIIVLILDWRIGLIFVLPFVPAAFIGNLFYKRFESDWNDWEKNKEKSMGRFCQSVINVKTVQDCVQEDHEAKSFTAIRDYMEDLDIDLNMTQRYYFVALGLLLDSCFVIAIAMGVYLVTINETTVGTIVYLIATGNVTIQNIGEMFHNYARIMRYLVSVNRMKELMDEPLDVVNGETVIVPENYQGEFEFNKVTFTYPGKDKPVLEEFSLKINPGQMVAFVGRSGEGKTTVVRLLARVYDIGSGRLTLDGNEINQLDRNWFRSRFAVVQQDVDIFDATLQENIRYSFPDATAEEVSQALKAAHLDIILANKERFPDGLETQVGERGVRLSGGEKQRVGIARAYVSLLKGANVLILDEATSSLDSEAERAIQNMINKLRAETQITIVAIAHRLSTIQRADEIFVINGGVITESGDHQKLMAQNGLYSRLVELQKLGELRT
jgi:ABC-type multidrug transport system fused ATPase/permease subunit